MILVLVFSLKFFLIIILENGQRDLILSNGRNVEMYDFTNFHLWIDLGIPVAISFLDLVTEKSKKL